MSTVVLIPGLVCDDTVWQPFLNAYAGPAVVADLTTQSSITAMAKDCLASYCGQLCVVGHSMGGRVALEMARIAPHRVSKLVLMSTAYKGLQDGEMQQRLLAKSMTQEHGMQALAQQWLAGMVYRKNQRNSEMMIAIEHMLLQSSSEVHERQIDALINRPDASEYLGEIRCRTLLVVGKEDTWSPVQQHVEMRALLPNASLRVIDNAGHFVMLEQEALVTPLLVDFLQ